MKPSLPQGTRDFSAEEVYKRSFIFNTIKKHFQLFGYAPLETPAFENLDTLMGKYGEEGDKLIFKILNNGLERPEKHEKTKVALDKVLQGKSTNELTERALKYDLTIPFARYIAMNHGKLTFPFKRYQIQPVWRADKPQRGRYREFYQCDADVVGSRSLFNEIELVQLYKDVFAELKIPVAICINNRKILAALAALCGGDTFLIPITVAIDKLDKIGIDKVIEELGSKGITPDVMAIIKNYLNITSLRTNSEKLDALKNLLASQPVGIEGIADLDYVLQYHTDIQLDVTLARGLNYYTGSIFEVKPNGVQMGSIGGGGRYDNLTELFGVPDIAGVGISFGVDRIYDVMEELQLFPTQIEPGTQVMLVNTGATFEAANRAILNQLRAQQISCEMYPEEIKFDKQLKYANKRGFHFVGILGDNEAVSQSITLKDFAKGTQEVVAQSHAAQWIKDKLS